MRAPRRRGLPVLDRLAADPAERAPGRPTGRPRVLRPARRPLLETGDHSRWSRSTTGTCPQALEDDGGWLNRATTDHFQEYAAIVGGALGDRVEHWIPVNEPNVVTMLGYGNGTHAPGKNLMFDALRVAHHLLLGHGKAAIALRQAGATSVGCANNHAPMWPVTDNDADVGATKLFDAIWNALYAEPMLFGRYPADIAPIWTR